MYRFWKILTLPLLDAQKPKVVVEIGSQQGFNTRLLYQFCSDNNAVLHTIDPEPVFEVSDIRKGHDEVLYMHKDLSLNVLSSIHNIDAVLIDGDHNWYTVYHELNILAGLSKQDGRPFPLVLFHDVSWPYARRDLYYNPGTIPEEFRHDYARKGMLPKQAGLSDIGFNSKLYNALHEGGPRNGVLTAIEDFLVETNEAMHFYTIPAFNGYGILVAEARFIFCSGLRKQLAGLLPSESVRLLIADLEEDRLEIKSNLLKRGQAIAEKGQAIAEKDQAIAKKDQAIAKKDQAIAKKDQAIAHYREELYSVYTSRSWRYTAPLRRVGSRVRRVLGWTHKPRVRRVIKYVYYLLPAFIRQSWAVECLKNRFKKNETIIYS